MYKNVRLLGSGVEGCFVVVLCAAINEKLIAIMNKFNIKYMLYLFYIIYTQSCHVKIICFSALSTH